MTRAYEKLNFEVIDYSSYQERGFPDNLNHINKDDDEYYWSVSDAHQPHFVLLRFPAPSIISKFSFSMNEATLKVITMKGFRIYGMLDSGSWEIIYQGSLLIEEHSKDQFYMINEQFRRTIFRYVKIEPYEKILSSDFLRVPPIIFEGVCVDTYRKFTSFNEYSKETSHIIGDLTLKSLRTPFTFEIHKSVCDGMMKGICFSDKCFKDIMGARDYQKYYDMFFNIVENDLYDSYVENVPLELKYTLIEHTETKEQTYSNAKPCPRGGHQIAYDQIEHCIYLFGGWDGSKDLSDMWKFDIANEKWFQISSNTAADGGPNPRSCHQMCLSSKNRKLYVLGRYVDGFRPGDIENDFYVYDLIHRTWVLLTEDTARYDGPNLCFGHSMVYDEQTDHIYVFGGNVISEHSYSAKYGGFYTYHVETDCWISSLMIDGSSIKTDDIPSRSDHNLLLCDINRNVYITGGTRGNQNVSQIIQIDLETGLNTVLYNKPHVIGDMEPNYLYTTRSFLLENGKYIASYSGMERVLISSKQKLTNSFFLFDIQKKKWTCIYTNKHLGRKYWDKNTTEPCPRYALQIVKTGGKYDFHMFGGNPGSLGTTNLRLNDLWGGKIVKHTTKEYTKFLVRHILKERLVYLFSMKPLAAFIFLKKYSTYLIKEKIFDDETLENIALDMFMQVDNTKMTITTENVDFVYSKNQHFYNLFKVLEPIVDFISTPAERYIQKAVSEC